MMELYVRSQRVSINKPLNCGADFVEVVAVPVSSNSMSLPIATSSIFSFIDFAGVVAGATGGALEAKRNQTYAFDFVGVIGLGFISALGGGITRDLLLQHGPPLAFTDVRYLLLAFGGALIGLICGATLGSGLPSRWSGLTPQRLAFLRWQARRAPWLLASPFCRL